MLSKTNGWKARKTPPLKPNEPDIRLLIKVSDEKFQENMKENDIVILPEFFKDQPGEDTIYEKLIKEVNNCAIEEDGELFESHHQNSHVKIPSSKSYLLENKCPTLDMITIKMKEFFNMEVKKRRFNLYRDNTDWKPYHHDRSAQSKEFSDFQNFTVSVTFGHTRTVSFKNAKNGTRLDLPLTNGSVYTFANQINIDWQHGVIKEDDIKKEGRISIVLWSKNNQISVLQEE